MTRLHESADEQTRAPTDCRARAKADDRFVGSADKKREFDASSDAFLATDVTVSQRRHAGQPRVLTTHAIGYITFVRRRQQEVLQVS